MLPRSQKASHKQLATLETPLVEAWKHFSAFMRVPVCVRYILFLLPCFHTKTETVENKWFKRWRHFS